MELTEIQLNYVRLAAQGLTAIEIADVTGRTKQTIRTTLRKISVKLGINRNGAHFMAPLTRWYIYNVELAGQHGKGMVGWDVADAKLNAIKSENLNAGEEIEFDEENEEELEEALEF